VSIETAIIAWLVLVVVTSVIVAYLAHRWGHDPFGWVLLSAVMGPIALIALIGTHQSDRTRSKETTGTPAPAAQRVLIASDGSAAGPAVARRIASTYRGDLEVVVLTVLPHELRPGPGSPAGPDHDRLVMEATEETLEVLRDLKVPARLEVSYGSAGEEIAACSRRLGVGLICMGRRGSGLSRALLGSVSDHVVRHSSTPVLIYD
jgi:nucleotide-binding universal stress UspA family protein